MVDIKDNEVDPTDVIASRIENAVAILGIERIKWVPPDCGFWMFARSVADEKWQPWWPDAISSSGVDQTRPSEKNRSAARNLNNANHLTRVLTGLCTD
ncbi:MAG: hypothetical protein CM1200mP34_0570 [Verrucomicrobiales bacterium]|nr:MAG: hypothetical protein CM1200mP34_0570 [Verrucomicrobiales bacterium]